MIPTPTRNIELEILPGQRGINHGEDGRIINVPSVTSIREQTGLSHARSLELLAVCPYASGVGTGPS